MIWSSSFENLINKIIERAKLCKVILMSFLIFVSDNTNIQCLRSFWIIFFILRFDFYSIFHYVFYNFRSFFWVNFTIFLRYYFFVIYFGWKAQTKDFFLKFQNGHRWLLLTTKTIKWKYWIKWQIPPHSRICLVPHKNYRENNKKLNN